MRRLVSLVLVAALLGGCVAPSAPERADLTALQDAWATFSLDLDYALSSQEARAIIAEAEFDEMKDKQRDWWSACVLFADYPTLKHLYDVGYHDAFMAAVYWSADDRGHIRDRNDAEAYDDLVRNTLN